MAARSSAGDSERMTAASLTGGSRDKQYFDCQPEQRYGQQNPNGGRYPPWSRARWRVFEVDVLLAVGAFLRIGMDLAMTIRTWQRVVDFSVVGVRLAAHPFFF